MTEAKTDENGHNQSPGQLLASARKQKGIELPELAEQIKVPLAVLEAIEKDKTPKNLPDTFIRGYKRSYAKKVGVNEALVLPEVETVGVVEQADKEMQSFSRRNKREAIERRLTAISWLIAAILLTALVIWWWQDNPAEDFAPVAGTEVIPVALDTELEETNTTENATQNATPTVDDITVSQQQVVEQSPVVTTAPVEAAATEQQAPVVLSEAEKALVADNGEPDEDGFIKVEMSFTNDCWVEVYDVRDERIAIGNKPAGYFMTLNAQGPLNVLLGNPDGVSIWVNGKLWDMSNLAKNKVARFELEAL